MNVDGLLQELYGRIPPLVVDVVDDLGAEELAATVVPGTNSIGWLVWHLTRVQDHHVAELLDAPQLWATGGWASHFGVDPDPGNTGYGHGPDEVAGIRPEGPEVLVDYHAAVATRTHELLARASAADLSRVVDEGWDPPVTLGVRLVSIACDALEHVGQAAYLRGLLARR